MKELFVMWIDSYGQALKLANSVSHEGGEILDCSVIGKWSQIMIDSENVKNIEAMLIDIPSEYNYQKKLLKNVDPRVIDAYLSLAGDKIQDFLLVIEHDFIGEVFEISQKMLAEDFRIVDLRLLRFQEPKSLLLVTGENQKIEMAQLIFQNFVAQNGLNMKMNIIENVNTKVKNLFHLD